MKNSCDETYLQSEYVSRIIMSIIHLKSKFALRFRISQSRKTDN